jgi:hypothetical protein
MKEFHIPETLSELVTKNKESLAIEQLQPKELKTLIKEDLIGYRKGTITDAYVISLTIDPTSCEPCTKIHILGRHEELSNSYITSQVVAFNEDLSIVQTKSGSLYKISSYVDEEISPQMIIHLCAFLHTWGMGKYFGIPHFYF